MQLDKNKITLEGAWMESLCKNRPGDFSEPGLVIKIGECKDFVQIETPMAKIKRPVFNWLCIAQLNFAGRMKAFGQRLYSARKQKKHRGFIQ